MESSSGDIEEGTEDIPGRKKSKLKSLRTRLFKRSKATGGEGNGKHSQSSSDITAEQGLGSEEDLVCSQGIMGSRALSHDSIFLAEDVLTDMEPARVLSQENVHSKIKALQIKLQQQKMHLGPPPLVVPVRRPGDLCGPSEDGGPADTSASDVASQGVAGETVSQPRPLSPVSKPALTKLAPQFPSHPVPLPVPSVSPIVDSPLDFSSPPQFTPCLDTSAARHRMSVKPRNQRASTKKKLATQNDSRLPSHARNNIKNPESVEEQEQRFCAPDKVSLETEQEEMETTTVAQHLPSKSPEVTPITLEEAPKSSGLTSSHLDQAAPGRTPYISSKVHRHQRPVDVTSGERPNPSSIESELETKRDSEIQVMNSLQKTGMTEETLDQISSTSSSARPSSSIQQVKDEIESMRGIKRSAPGSGSFHFSISTAKNQDRVRPRSGSFVGVLIQAEARHKSKRGTEEKCFAGLREKDELKDRVGAFAVGRLKQEGSLRKGSGISWDEKDSLKKTEPVASGSKNAAADTGNSAQEEVESSLEEGEEAVEAREEVQEEEGKTAFGVKLRSTSQSMRFRADAIPNHSSKPPVSEDQCDGQNRQEMSDNVGYASKKPRVIPCTLSTSGDVKVSDPTLSGSSLPLKNTPPSTFTVQETSSEAREVGTGPSVPQEPQPAPTPASSEVSWMSLAMEKTRTLQQLFTSRFPRDFAGAQTAARPQAQVQPTTQTEAQVGAQTQTRTAAAEQGPTPSQAASQPSSDTVKTATVHSASQAQAVKPPLVSVQQNTTALAAALSNTPKEAQTSKPTSESQSHPSATQCLSHPSVQSKPWTPQFPMRSSTQADTPSQFALQGSATQCLAQSFSSQHTTSQPPAWSNRGVHLANQLKPAASVSTTAPPPQVSAPAKGERDADAQERECPSPTGRRAVWAKSVSERAAFLEKRAECITPAGAKEVELKKAQTEVQSSDESPVAANTTSLSIDTKPEGRPGVKLTESSPSRVPDRPREDKWLRKNTTSSSPSSSPTQSSELQSMSGGGQPSWMELAKRKSMAWSDKTMD